MDNQLIWRGEDVIRNLIYSGQLECDEELLALYSTKTFHTKDKNLIQKTKIERIEKRDSERDSVRKEEVH